MAVLYAVVIDNRELKQIRRRRQQERQKRNMFRLPKQLCTCITLFSIFLCRHCATSTVEDVNTRRLSFSFPELRYRLEEELNEMGKAGQSFKQGGFSFLVTFSLPSPLLLLKSKS